MKNFQNTHFYIINSEPDKLNRQSFEIWWWGFNINFNIDTWKGQYFFAELEPHMKRGAVLNKEIKICTFDEFGEIYKEHNNIDYICPCYKHLYKN